MSEKILTAEEVAEIRERADKATGGPWYHKTTEYEDSTDERIIHRIYWDAGTLQHPPILPPVHTWEGNWPNGDFIAHSRTDVPALCASHEALRGECKRLRDECFVENSVFAKITTDLGEMKMFLTATKKALTEAREINEALRQRCEEAESRLAEAEGLLGECEWLPYGDYPDNICHECRNQQWQGHRGNCRLAAFLEGKERG